MNKKEKFALFLGMLSGDGCLSIKHNGQGYRVYPIQFCNTNEELVNLFNQLFFEIYGFYGQIGTRQRVNRKRIWAFTKHSRKISDELVALGFPEGVKRDYLKVPQSIKAGKINEKLAFIAGVIMTDGHVGDRRILFHSGSKLFLEDLSEVISEVINVRKPVKEFIQRKIYRSYQLSLNKHEKEVLLSVMPGWHNGNASVLSFEDKN